MSTWLLEREETKANVLSITSCKKKKNQHEGKDLRYFFCGFFDIMPKRRRYTVTDVLDEVFADSDSGFDPDITNANDKKLWELT